MLIINTELYKEKLKYGVVINDESFLVKIETAKKGNGLIVYNKAVYKTRFQGKVQCSLRAIPLSTLFLYQKYIQYFQIRIKTDETGSPFPVA